jgi:hypothetical protein
MGSFSRTCFEQQQTRNRQESCNPKMPIARERTDQKGYISEVTPAGSPNTDSLRQYDSRRKLPTTRNPSIKGRISVPESNAIE